MEYTKEQIDTAFRSLPEPLQDAIMSEDVNTALQQLAKEYTLHLDKADLVGKHAVYVLMGLETKEDFRNMLNTLGMDKEQAAKLNVDVEKRVFEKVFEAFRAATQKQQPVEELAPAPSATEQQSGEPAKPTKIDPYREPID